MTETIPQPREAALDSGDGDPVPGTGLLVLAPMLLEANAVRRGLTQQASQVRRAGVGQGRASKVGLDSQLGSFSTVIVMGTAAALDDDLSPGDLVVATEVTDGTSSVPLPGAVLLAAALRRAGLRARAGKIVTVGHLVKSAERSRRAPRGGLPAGVGTAAVGPGCAGRAGAR